MADDERSAEEPKMPGTVRKDASSASSGTTEPPKAGDSTGSSKTIPVTAGSSTGSGPGTGTGTAPTKESTPGTSRPAAPAAESDQTPDPLRGSRTSGIWIGLIVLGLLLVLLIIFFTQNTQEAEVNFLGWQGRAPQAALLLAAAVAGLFLTVIAGSLRILQLRRRVRKVTKAQKKQAKKQAKEQRASAK